MAACLPCAIFALTAASLSPPAGSTGKPSSASITVGGSSLVLDNAQKSPHLPASISWNRQRYSPPVIPARSATATRGSTCRRLERDGYPVPCHQSQRWQVLEDLPLRPLSRRPALQRRSRDYRSDGPRSWTLRPSGLVVAQQGIDPRKRKAFRAHSAGLSHVGARALG